MNIEETLQMHPNLNVGDFHVCFGFAFWKSNVKLIIKEALFHILKAYANEALCICGWLFYSYEGLNASISLAFTTQNRCVQIVKCIYEHLCK